MPRTATAFLATALLIGGSGIALAQSSGEYQDHGSDQSSYGSPSGMRSDADSRWGGDQNRTDQDFRSGGRSRSSLRALMRRELRQAGFQNIRVLDAQFLVRAETPSGRQVLMVINPPDRTSDNTDNRSSWSDRQARRDEHYADRGEGDRSGMDRGQDYATNANRGYSPDRSQQYGSNQDGRPNDQRPMTENQMSERQIRSILRSRGFSNISDGQYEGYVYTAMADWYGEQVDVVVDGRTGRIVKPRRLTLSQVENMLIANGWEDIAHVQRHGSMFEADATRNGTRYDLAINARTGEIENRTEQRG